MGGCTSSLGMPDVKIKPAQIKKMKEANDKASKEYMPFFRDWFGKSLKQNADFDLAAHIKFAKEKSGDPKNVTGKAFDAVAPTLRPEIIEMLNEDENAKDLPNGIKKKAADKAIQAGIDKAFDEMLNDEGKKMFEAKDGEEEVKEEPIAEAKE